MAFNTQFGPELAMLLERERRGLKKAAAPTIKKASGLLPPIADGPDTPIPTGSFVAQVLDPVMPSGEQFGEEALRETFQKLAETFKSVAERDFSFDISQMRGIRGWAMRKRLARNPQLAFRMELQGQQFKLNAMTGIATQMRQIVTELRQQNADPIAEAGLKEAARHEAERLAALRMTNTLVDVGAITLEQAPQILAQFMGVDPGRAEQRQQDQTLSMFKLGERFIGVDAEEAAQLGVDTPTKRLAFEQGQKAGKAEADRLAAREQQAAQREQRAQTRFEGLHTESEEATEFADKIRREIMNSAKTLQQMSKTRIPVMIGEGDEQTMATDEFDRPIFLPTGAEGTQLSDIAAIERAAKLYLQGREDNPQILQIVNNILEGIRMMSGESSGSDRDQGEVDPEILGRAKGILEERKRGNAASSPER